MKRLLILTVLLTILLTIFAGCQTLRDPNMIYEDILSEELKQDIYHELLMQQDVLVNLDYIDHYSGGAYYGTINDCVIIREIQYNWFGTTIGRFEVAGYTFEYGDTFYLYVYRDGEVCQLKEAYENGWLTKEQIEVIHAKHNQRYAKELKQKEDDAGIPTSYYSSYYIYREPLARDMEQEIEDALLTQCGVSINWDDAYTFYGTINGCVVLMNVEPGSKPVYCNQMIAHYVFEWREPFELYVYRDGEACTLQEAYEKEWLDQGQMHQIRSRNLQDYAENYAKDLKEQESIPVASDLDEFDTKSFSDDLKNNISKALLEQYSIQVSWHSVAYKGTINDCAVIHIDGSSSSIKTYRMIAGYKFEWSGSFKIFAYRNGEVCELQEAYEKEWLTINHIEKIYTEHKRLYDKWFG